MCKNRNRIRINFTGIVWIESSLCYQCDCMNVWIRKIKWIFCIMMYQKSNQFFNIPNIMTHSSDDIFFTFFENPLHFNFFLSLYQATRLKICWAYNPIRPNKDHATGSANFCTVYSMVGSSDFANWVNTLYTHECIHYIL